MRLVINRKPKVTTTDGQKKFMEEFESSYRRMNPLDEGQDKSLPELDKAVKQAGFKIKKVQQMSPPPSDEMWEGWYDVKGAPEVLHLFVDKRGTTFLADMPKYIKLGHYKNVSQVAKSLKDLL